MNFSYRKFILYFEHFHVLKNFVTLHAYLYNLGKTTENTGDINLHLELWHKVINAHPHGKI